MITNLLWFENRKIRKLNFLNNQTSKRSETRQPKNSLQHQFEQMNVKSDEESLETPIEDIYKVITPLLPI